MKNTNRLLAVILAVAIAISGIVITTMTTNAIDVTVDNTKDVIATVNGSDIAGDGDGGNATAYSRDEAAGTFSFNGDCGNFYGIYLKGVEAGVYKVAYYMTLENVSGNDRIRFKPYGGDVYYNVSYGTLRQYEGMKVMVVAVINATGDFEVGGWPATGLYATIDKVEIAKANYDFGANAGDYILIEEGTAQDIPGGYTQPTEDQWTKSTSNKLSTTQELNTQAWSYDNNEGNYKALFGDGAHGTNGNTVKATVAAGTGLTVRDCPATGAPSMNLNADGYVIKYTGVIEAAESGWYQLAAYKIDNGYVAYVGGEKVFDYGKWNNWFDSNRLMYCGDNFYMEAGVKYSYEAYYIEQGGGDAIEPMVLVDGKNRSFANAGISFYANASADDATVTIDNSAPALEATTDDILYYKDLNLTITEDAQAVDIGVDKISGKTDVTIELVVRPFNIRNDGGLMTNNSGLIGIGEQDNTDRYILLGFMEGGALKVAVKASSDANVERQTAMGLFNNNKWVTLKYVFTAASVKTYADGILVCENDISGAASIGEFTGKFLIGDITSWPDAGFRGQIAEVRVTTPAAEDDGEDEGGEDVVTINPYETVKAGVDATDLATGTTYDGSQFGVETNGGDNDGGVGTTYDGAWMQYANVAFGDNGAKSITINYISKASRMMEDAAAEIWIDGMEGTGTKVGTVALPVPEDVNADYTKLVATADLETVVTGTHDLYIVLTGTCDNTQDNEYVANVTNFVFTEVESEDDNTGDDNTGDDNTGDDNTGDDNTGDDNTGDDNTGDDEEVVLVEGLNAKAWNFAGDEANYKALFGDLAIGKNGDVVKATVAAGTGLTVRDCQAIVAADYVIDGDNYVIKYNGVMTVAEDGWYQFATSKIDNGYVAYVGGVKVLDYVTWNWWNDTGNDICYGQTVYLEAGVKYAYEAYFVEQGGGQVIIPQVIKADGTLCNYADAGFKFYANDTAENVAPAKWEDVAHTMSGMTGINGSIGVVEEKGVIKMPATATGELWNYTWHGYEKDSVIKVAWYITVDSVSDDVDPDGVNIAFSNNFFVEGNGGLDIPNSVFTENVGKDIIIVGVFNQPNTGMEGRWNIKTPGIAFTVNKVVIGNADTDFDCAAATMGGYSLVFEEANEEDIEFTASDAIANEDAPSGSVGTGDVASVAALLLAGAAALGGLKLRKKSK